MAEQENSPKVRIAIVGMTGAGKTVLISALAMKMSQMADQGIFLTPMGETRRQTLRYVQTNWETLNNGQWPPSTPAGELIHLEWELNTKKNVALARFTDCAGQDIRTIFSRENFNVRHLSADLFETFFYLKSANILIFLVNMEDLLGKSMRESVENALDIDQMIYVLNQKSNVPRKVAVVFSQYDKYKPEVDIKYGGDLLEYIRANLPQLHGEYVQKKSFDFIPVAAVNKTRLELVDGEAKQVPQPGFDSYNLDSLIWWIGDQVDALAGQIENADRYSSEESIPYEAIPKETIPYKTIPEEPVPSETPWSVKEPPEPRPEVSVSKKNPVSARNSVFPVLKGCGCGLLSMFAGYAVLVTTIFSGPEAALTSFILGAALIILIIRKLFGKATKQNQAAAFESESTVRPGQISTNKSGVVVRLCTGCFGGCVCAVFAFVGMCVILAMIGMDSDGEVSDTMACFTCFLTLIAWFFGIWVGWNYPKR